MIEDEAKAVMERHGITAAHRAVYHYKGFNYANFADALNYAELVTSRLEELPARRRGKDTQADSR